MGEPFTIDPKEVRQIATRMGIPPSTGLPMVQVEEREYAGLESVKKTPKWKRKYPAGYHIFVPEGSLTKVTKDEYTLGPLARDHIRHELRHYTKRRRQPKTPTSPKMGWKKLLAWELDAELKSGIKSSPSKNIADAVRGVAQEHKVPEEEVMGEARKIAPKMGASERVLDTAESLLKGYPPDTKGKSLTEAVERTPERKRAPLKWEETRVRAYERGGPRRSRTRVQSHKRHTLKRQE